MPIKKYFSNIVSESNKNRRQIGSLRRRDNFDLYENVPADENRGPHLGVEVIMTVITEVNYLSCESHGDAGHCRNERLNRHPCYEELLRK